MLYNCLNIYLNAEGSLLPACFEPFIVDNGEIKEDIGMILVVYTDEDFSGLSIIENFTYIAYSVNLLANGDVLFLSPDRKTGLLAGKKVWKICQTGLPNDEDVRVLLWAALQCALIPRGILTLHSAAVSFEGKAYLFSGESGRGKSTRAAKWVSALDAQWISGDRPAIDPEKGMVFGVPWDGKEQIFSNVCYPAECIFEVRRSPVTMLKCLTEKQMYRFLIHQVFIPMWDPELSAKALALLKQLCRNFKGYRLFCGPEEQSAVETLDILRDNMEQIKKEEISEMKLKNCVIREMDGDYNLIPTGTQTDTFKGVVILNSVSAYILEQIREKSLAREDLLEMILAKYEVTREEASSELDELLDKMRSYGMLIEG